MRLWRSKNKEKSRANSKKYASTHADNIIKKGKKYLSDPRRRLIVRAKRRAREKKLEINITYNDIVIPEFCPVLDLKISTTGPLKDTTASIDRIDNKKGYIKDNIVVISARANRIKNDATIEELYAVIKYMEFHKHK